MLTSSELERITQACNAIGNEAADESGFVAMGRLLERFDAHLQIRPLLVEGMLVSVSQPPAGAKRNGRWAVLVDRETFPVTQDVVLGETSERPLPSRLRNTIAHELVHSLAFRPSEFGLRLETKGRDEKSLSQLVEDIERQTERLSPLLLWPEKALAQLLSGKNGTLTLEELIQVREKMGISRSVLVSRLNLLRQTDENRFLFSKGLRNLALGVAMWGPGAHASIKGWPLFGNFDDNIVPTFLRVASDKEYTPASSLFKDESLAMCGGPNRSVDVVVDAGTPTSQRSTRMTVEVSIEHDARKAGREFLFSARKRTPQ